MQQAKIMESVLWEFYVEFGQNINMQKFRILVLT